VVTPLPCSADFIKLAQDPKELAAVSLNADVSVVKTADIPVAYYGDIVTYTITVTNNGPDDADCLYMNESIPHGQLENIEYSDDNGASWIPVNPRDSFGYIVSGSAPSGTKITTLIRGKVSVHDPGIITNTATAGSKTPDSNLENNSSTFQVILRSFADLSVAISADYSPVNAGEELVYTITVSNSGPDDAENVVLMDDIYAILLNPRWFNGSDWVPWQGPYSMGIIASGSKKVVIIRGIINPALDLSSISSIINIVYISSDTPDIDLSNNNSFVITPVTLSADLSMKKTGAPNPVTAGEIVTYTLAITNNGPSDARNSVLKDIIPPEIVNTEFSLDYGDTWRPWFGKYPVGDETTGRIAAGESIIVLIRGQVSADTVGKISNTATIISSTPDPDLSNNSSTEVTTTKANL